MRGLDSIRNDLTPRHGRVGHTHAHRVKSFTRATCSRLSPDKAPGGPAALRSDFELPSRARKLAAAAAESESLVSTLIFKPYKTVFGCKVKIMYFQSPRANYASRTASKPTTHGRPKRAAPAVRHSPVDPQIWPGLFTRIVHGVVVLECGLRARRALRSTDAACRRCRAGS